MYGFYREELHGMGKGYESLVMMMIRNNYRLAKLALHITGLHWPVEMNWFLVENEHPI